MDLQSTLNLPDNDFSIPMKANLPALEPEIQAKWEALGVYHLIQKERAGAPSFVLHDGPPYTNSPIHIGTALNKILKDFVVKSRSMMGFRCPYVPGFDNHGLPIEQSVMKQFQEKGEKPDVLTLRKACREHAQKYIEIQTGQFKRLGCFGFWEKPYTTMNPRFEAEIVRVFNRLVSGGYVYKGLRPTLWSPTSRTALADTEIVYQDHTSKAIYVRFPLQDDAKTLFEGFSNVYCIIWTTTPWTIPANLAVAFHPNVEYALVKHGNDHYLLANPLVERVAQELDWSTYETVKKFEGSELEGTLFRHPIYSRNSVGVLAEYVTTEDGTGVVHTAPGHGRDDFYTGQKYGLPILCPVDEGGVLTQEAGEFAGIFYKKCDQAVVDRLRELGNLLHAYDYQHSYPYAERDGQPVIFRATEQWFVSIDVHGLRGLTLDVIQKIKWHPEHSINRITAMISGSPDWCISRQRPWGVGIPIFYGKDSREPVLDSVAIESIAKVIELGSSDAWFELEPSAILPSGYTHPQTGESSFSKEIDVLDVWFDSGSTALCVLEGNVEPEWKEDWPADLYLEGSDQHRGWFNKSLLISMATRGETPYKEVLTHGFVVDEKGLKMSKRLGNVVDPQAAADQYGADILRFWVASVNYENDVPCSDSILKQFGESYRRIRNTLKYLLSNLYDFDASSKPELLELDRWILEQAHLLVDDCVKAYEHYDFMSIAQGVHNFCVNQLSAFYNDAIKDRMYCDGKDWPSRRSAQWACHGVLIQLVKLLAPILVHTAEEVYSRIPGLEKKASVHLEAFEAPSPELIAQIEESELQIRFARMLEARAEVFSLFEQWKIESQVKDSQDVIATYVGEEEMIQTLRSFGQELAIYFKMSAVELQIGEAKISFRPSEYLKCERSRLRRADVEPTNGHVLSLRDRKVLGYA